MKKKLKAALGKRRGISIVEVAVALSIIVLISAAAMSLVTTASRLDGEAVYTAEINGYAESTMNCFRWADNHFDFEYAVDVFGFEPMETPAEDGTDPETKDETDPESDPEAGDESEGEGDPEAASSNDYWYVLTREGYRIEVRVNYATYPYEFEINAVNKDGEEIYRFTYEK